MTTRTDFRIHQASPRLGAEISGVDLTRPVSDATAGALRRAFWTHKVLVFRGQHLSPDQQVEAVRIFDEPFDHPTAAHRHPDNRLVYVYDLEKAGSAAHWHVGGLWRTPPFSIEPLTYQVVPEVGGHTLWADLQAAYDSLSEPLKNLLEPVSAVYDGNAENYGGSGARAPLAQTIEHPVVRTHRYTGRKGLFISSSALRLTGLEPPESQAILPFLLAHASSPDFTINYGWKPGDFVLWDNLATWHYAVNDYDGPRAYRKVIAAQPAEARPRRAGKASWSRVPLVAKVAAQRGRGVLGPVQTPALQDRHHVVGEQLDRAGQDGRLQGEPVTGSLGQPALDQVGELLGRPGELQAAGQAGELLSELPERPAGLLGPPREIVGTAGAVRGRDGLLGERAVGIDQRGVEPGVVGQVAPPELGVDPVLQGGPQGQGLGFRATQHEGHAWEHEHVAGVTTVAAGRRAHRVPEPAAGGDVGLRGEHQVGGLPGQLDAGAGRTGLRERGPALR